MRTGPPFPSSTSTASSSVAPISCAKCTNLGSCRRWSRNRRRSTTKPQEKTAGSPAVFLGPGAVNAFDFVDSAQRAHHVRQVIAIAHLDTEEHVDHITAGRPLHRHIFDIGSRIG